MSSRIDERIDILVLSGQKLRKLRHRVETRTTSEIHAGQRVYLEGREETFVVLRIDRARHLADLLREGAVRRVETGIPLALLRPAQEHGAANNFPVSA